MAGNAKQEILLHLTQLLTVCTLFFANSLTRPKDKQDDASYGGYHLSYEVKKLM